MTVFEKHPKPWTADGWSVWDANGNQVAMVGHKPAGQLIAELANATPEPRPARMIRRRPRKAARRS